MEEINNFKFVSKLFLTRFSRRDMPLTVIFNVTSRCNAKCFYCYAKYYNRKIEDLSTDDIFRIVDILKRNGNQRISLSGGEPLLREDIGKIIRYIKKNGIVCTLNSNGYLVPDRINEIKELDTLILSIDGDKDGHNKNREENSFEKVIQAYHCALLNRIPVHTATILTKNNLHCIDFILELAKNNSTWAQFNIVVDKFSLTDTNSMKAGVDEYREALKKILKLKKEGYPVYFSAKAFEYTIKWEDYTRENFIGEEPNWPYVKCSAGKYRCVVDANGNLYPCELLIGKTPEYNILKDGENYIFTQLSKHNCKACYLIQQNDFNLVYRFEPSTILNYVKFAISPHNQKGRVL